MHPIIGISCDYEPDPKSGSRFFIKEDYVHVVEEGGGLPIILPQLGDASLAGEIVDKIQGLVISGGDFDLDPAWYGEQSHPKLRLPKPERAFWEQALLLAAGKRKLPILGICGGEQLLNVAFGGDLYQDLGTQFPGALSHEQTEDPHQPSHLVKLDPRSQLGRILGTSELMVNSTHHQAIKNLGKGLHPVAWAPDGVIEAIEVPNRPFVIGPFVIGVQWHPEALYRQEPLWRKLFSCLVNIAGRKD